MTTHTSSPPHDEDNTRSLHTQIERLALDLERHRLEMREFVGTEMEKMAARIEMAFVPVTEKLGSLTTDVAIGKQVDELHDREIAEMRMLLKYFVRGLVVLVVVAFVVLIDLLSGGRIRIPLPA